MKNNNQIFGFAQKLGKALMTPIAVLPAAAILLRFGSSDLLNLPWMEAAGNAVFGNLAIIFAISIAVSFAKNGNGVAAIAAALSHYVIVTVATSFNSDINLGVVSGIIAGLLAAALYNRFYNIKLPELLGFFGGKRFVPIITSLCSLVIGALMGFVWPPVQEGIKQLGMVAISAGPVGSFINGFINRLLLPFGLHHLSNSFVLFQLGEYTNAAGEVVTGDLTRFFAGDPNGGLFVTGGYAVYMFGFPAVALAMIRLAKLENRKAVAGVLGSAALTAIITGITEPIEYSFIFLSPILLVVNAFLFGLFNALSVALGIRMGIGFSNGLIDYIMTFQLARKPLLMIPVGIVAFVTYYFVFYYLFKKLNIPTPGRFEQYDLDEKTSVENKAVEADLVTEAPKKQKVDDVEKKAEAILQAVGGKANIKDIEACITRIRLSVVDDSKFNKDAVKKAGAIEIVSLGTGNYQIIIGTMADPIVAAMEDMI